MAAADAIEAAPEVSTNGPGVRRGARVRAARDRRAGARSARRRTTRPASTRAAVEAEPPAWTPAPAPPRLTRTGTATEGTGGAGVDPLADAEPPAEVAPADEPEPAEGAAEPPTASADDAAEPGDAEPPTREPMTPPTGDAEPAAHPGTSVAALLELGVPLRLLAGFDDPHASVPLSVLVRTFDRPRGVRLAPGAVVVVAGPAELAVRTAVAMAHRAGLAAHEVVLAGDVDALPGHGRRVQTTSAAARVRERVPDDAPVIVALGVGGTGSAAELLAAFEPDEAWAALDARLRAVELRRWLRAVGARRPFDAVAASHTFEAQAPGTVLNLGVPVGWLDGLPASPVVWAAVLSERLDDDARWD